MRAEKELRQELADLAVKAASAEKKLKILRRRPAGFPGGKQGASFVTTRESMSEAQEIARQLDALRQRELEIRAKLKKPGR